MEKSTKIIIGLGILGLLGYLIFKKKSSPKNITTVKKVVTPKKSITPIEPVPSEPLPINTPIVPSVPVIEPEPIVENPIIHPKTGKIVPPITKKPEIPENPISLPDLPPIVIDYSNLNPNIGSSLVNTNVVNTDPYANCKTQKEWDTIKMKGGYVPNNPCIIFEGTSSGQTGGSFDMKTTKDTTLENVNATLNDLMKQGKDYTNIYTPGSFGGERQNLREGIDPYGYGGVASA
jgi:hypothetical protein